MPKISVVIPCYFNEGNVPVTAAALLANENTFPPDTTFEYVFVDDGSGDETLDRLLDFKQNHPKRVTVVKLASNIGSYNAIYAGLKHATGDCIVVMAADLQDPPELIVKMYQLWRDGSKLVLATRIKQRNTSATVFYWFMRSFILPTLPTSGFDFCLFDKKAKDHLLIRMQADINSLYLLLTMNLPHEIVLYQKQQREIGTSKWTTKKKFRLARKTLGFFMAERSVILAYFWRSTKPENPEPFIIDEVF
jgi:polyisoprenyl-phosphate glycosyltransferase